MSEHFFEIRAFLGTDNTSDLAVIGLPKKAGMFFFKLDNVDIDDAWKLHRRKGYGSSIYSGTKIRSMWGNEKIMLFADGTTLKYMDGYNIAHDLITDITADEKFSYAELGYLVFFASPLSVGYINANTATAYPFPDPTEKFKFKMVGGQCIEYYNSRIYTGLGNNLFFSDATVVTRMDGRKNAIAFPSRITMLKAVNTGLYISDSEKVYFLKGRDPITEFIQLNVLDVPAIEGMSVANKVKGKITKKIVYWMTKKGPYAGYDDGIVFPQQKGLYNLDGLISGSAILKDGNYQQLVMVGQY